MKVALLTVYTDNLAPLADIVIPNMEAYCKKHDYTLYAFNITGTQDYFGYTKIEKLLSILSEIDVVLCLDLDTLITNHEIKVESFLDYAHDFYITKDVNGINAGSFIVKSSKWSQLFLKFILSQKENYHCEQNVIEDHFDNFSAEIKILDHPSINSLLYEEYGENFGIIGDKKIEKPTHEQGQWEKGDFILHLPGMTLEKRVQIFESIKPLIVK